MMKTQSDDCICKYKKVGFHFTPSDEELCEYYLRAKVERKPLPCSHVIAGEFKMYGDDVDAIMPWEIIKDDDPYWISSSECSLNKKKTKTLYIFTELIKSRKNSTKRFSRSAGCGTWRGQHTDDVVNVHGDVIGFNKLFSYYQDDKKVMKKKNSTDYGHMIMHEYSLVDFPNYVLCKIIKEVTVNIAHPRLNPQQPPSNQVKQCFSVQSTQSASSVKIYDVSISAASYVQECQTCVESAETEEDISKKQYINQDHGAHAHEESPLEDWDNQDVNDVLTILAKPPDDDISTTTLKHDESHDCNSLMKDKVILEDNIISLLNVEPISVDTEQRPNIKDVDHAREEDLIPKSTCSEDRIGDQHIDVIDLESSEAARDMNVQDIDDQKQRQHEQLEEANIVNNNSHCHEPWYGDVSVLDFLEMEHRMFVKEINDMFVTAPHPPKLQLNLKTTSVEREDGMKGVDEYFRDLLYTPATPVQMERVILDTSDYCNLWSFDDFSVLHQGKRKRLDEDDNGEVSPNPKKSCCDSDTEL